MRWQSTEYAPKRVAGVTHKNRDGSDRQRILKTCRAGMRVNLIHESDNPVDPNAVAIRIAGGQQIGYLAADVAQWVAPWLGSGQVDFACRIKSVESFESDDGRTMLGALITMTRLELVPGDPPLVTLAKFAVRPLVLMAKAGATVAPPIWSALISSLRRVCRVLATLANSCLRPMTSAAKAVDRGLATLAEGNTVMLNVFRITAAITVATLIALCILMLA
jgi:hypothetical protein